MFFCASAIQPAVAEPLHLDLVGSVAVLGVLQRLVQGGQGLRFLLSRCDVVAPRGPSPREKRVIASTNGYFDGRTFSAIASRQLPRSTA